MARWREKNAYQPSAEDHPVFIAAELPAPPSLAHPAHPTTLVRMRVWRRSPQSRSHAAWLCEAIHSLRLGHSPSLQEGCRYSSDPLSFVSARLHAVKNQLR